MSETSRSIEQRADRAFARYATEGDVDALAEVFDLCAPKLVLVAGHLAPFDRSTIDDLIQSTFADAIRSASRFEPGRPVLPWLTTILARRATDRARRSGRRAETPLEEVAEPFDELSLDPAELAADSELVERVLQAIDEVGPPYAEVLRLRWSHDLSPQEIARALDRPLGTVLSQCQRGLERLRKRLPDRMALVLAPLAVPDLQLGAIREEVLRLGHELARPIPVVPAPTPAPVPFLVAVMSTKILSVAVLIAALILLAVFAFDGDSPPQPTNTGSADASVAVAQGDVEREATERIADEPERAAEAPDSDPEVDGGLVHFSGRVLAAESGLPLAGVEVVATEEHGVYGPGTSSVRIVEHRTESDVEGRFQVSLRSPIVGGIRVRLLATDRVVMSAWYRMQMRDGLEFDFGDIEMTIGPRLQVTLLDEAGQPIPFATLQLGGDHGVQSGDFYGSGWYGMLRADANGRIESRGPMAPGEWEIEFVSDHGLEEPEETHIEVPARAGSVVQELRYGSVARPEWTLTGRVVDESGAPVTGVDVYGSREGDRGRNATQVMAFGRFVLPGLLEGRGRVRIDVGPSDSSDRHTYVVLQPSDRVKPGDEELLVVVRKIDPAHLRARLVDQSGTPVERFARLGHQVIERRDLVASIDTYGAARTTSHPDGEFVLGPLPDGRHRLLMFPERQDLEPIVTLDVDLAGDTEKSATAIARKAVQRVLFIRTQLGDPVPDAEVEWIAAPISPIDRAMSIQPISEVLRGRGGFSSLPAYSVASARSDAEGRLTLRTGPVLVGSRIKVSHPDFETFELDLEDEHQGAQPLIATLISAARLEGRLTPLDIVQSIGPDAADRRAAEISVDPVRVLEWSSTEVQLHREGTDDVFDALVDLQGGFRFTGLPAGRYRIALEPNRGDTTELGEIELKQGERRSETLDISALRTQPVRGVLRVNGEVPPPGTRLDLWPVVELKADGSFECELRIGIHEIRVEVPLPGGEEVGIDVGTIEVQSGVPTPVAQLDASYRSIDLEVVNDDGSPRKKAWVLWRPIVDGKPAKWRRVRLIGTDGRVRITHQWDHPIRFELGLTPPVEARGEWTDVLPIELIERPREVEPLQRRVRVPAGR